MISCLAKFRTAAIREGAGSDIISRATNLAAMLVERSGFSAGRDKHIEQNSYEPIVGRTMENQAKT